MTALHYATQASEVFVLPDAVFRIKQLIDDDSATMHDIAEVIHFDPALAAQVLKIANSALYKFPSKIDSITKAIQVIGTNSVYDLVVAYGVAKAFSSVDQEIIDLERFWEQSVCCALLAKYFGDRIGHRESERLFVAGLLHNIGELIMVRFNAQAAMECAQFNETRTPLELQMATLDTTYAEIGASLIEKWGIPESIYRPIRRIHHSHHMAEADDDKVLQLSYILALDNVYREFYPSNSNIDHELYEALGLEFQDLDTALEYTNLQAMSVLAMFKPKSVVIY